MPGALKIVVRNRWWRIGIIGGWQFAAKIEERHACKLVEEGESRRQESMVDQRMLPCRIEKRKSAKQEEYVKNLIMIIRKKEEADNIQVLIYSLSLVFIARRGLLRKIEYEERICKAADCSLFFPKLI